jgi:AP2-associated kinase
VSITVSTVIARSGTQPLTNRDPTTGGFAHVYLVRTSAPVYGTTHHVLKRIAVGNDSMLTDVKKEVDIMVSTRYFVTMATHSSGPQRILKGHPNIVHLIDAAWHRLSNGTYEVFILMEFCPGSQMVDLSSMDRN